MTQRPAIRDLFDWELLKGAVLDDRDRAALEIRSVGIGYAEVATALRSQDRADGDGWSVLASAMRAELPELAQFRSLEAAPPVGDSPGDLSRWLLRRALRWSGPLLPEYDARVMIGVTNESFATEVVQRWIATARYAGVFSDIEDRWWYERLRETLDGLFDLVAPVDSGARVARLSEVVGVDLEPEPCIWCREYETVRGCAVCGQAVDAVHSLPSLGAPGWALPRAICFKCILYGDADEEHFDDDSAEIADQVKRGEFGKRSS